MLNGHVIPVINVLSYYWIPVMFFKFQSRSESWNLALGDVFHRANVALPRVCHVAAF